MDLFESKSIAPMLIKNKNSPPFDSYDYLFELKLDGIRCVAYLDQTGTILRNKSNRNITAIYPELSLINLKVNKRCILDGEVFVMINGRTDFYEVERRALMGNPFKIKLAVDRLPVSFVAFDILYIDSKQTTELPLESCKEILHGVVQEESSRFAVSRSYCA